MSEAKAAPYQYLESGLDNVILLNGFEFRQTPYGRVLTIQNVEGLHKSIAKVLVEKQAPLTGKEFRFLRLELEFSQGAMGVLCGVSERQVRNIEKSETVSDPQNIIIRYVYKQRYVKDEKYESFAQIIRRFQEFDRRQTEMLLKSTSEGWEPTDRDAPEARQSQFAL